MMYGWPETDESKQMLIDSVRAFAKSEIAPKAAEIDREHRFPTEIVKQLGEMGLLGMMVPEEYGGMGLDFNTGLLFTEALSLGLAFATTIGAQVSIGSLPIVFYGTHEQKEKYLPKIATGEYACSYALTEPGAGSDANSGKTNAKRFIDSFPFG